MSPMLLRQGQETLAAALRDAGALYSLIPRPTGTCTACQVGCCPSIKVMLYPRCTRSSFMLSIAPAGCRAPRSAHTFHCAPTISRDHTSDCACRVCIPRSAHTRSCSSRARKCRPTPHQDQLPQQSPPCPSYYTAKEVLKADCSFGLQKLLCEMSLTDILATILAIMSCHRFFVRANQQVKQEASTKQEQQQEGAVFGVQVRAGSMKLPPFPGIPVGSKPHGASSQRVETDTPQGMQASCLSKC
eukprot:1160688-Pelagomonas_calceolata.AAC.8